MHKAKNPIQWPAPMALHMTEKDRAQPWLPPTMPEYTNIFFGKHEYSTVRKYHTPDARSQAQFFFAKDARRAD